MWSSRAQRRLIAAQLGLIGAAVLLAVATAGISGWRLDLLAALLACAVVSDLTAVESPAPGIKLSGGFLSLVLAMVFLGGSAAAAIGVAAILIGWLRSREPFTWLLSNVVTYAW